MGFLDSLDALAAGTKLTAVSDQGSDTYNVDKLKVIASNLMDDYADLFDFCEKNPGQAETEYEKKLKEILEDTDLTVAAKVMRESIINYVSRGKNGRLVPVLVAARDDEKYKGVDPWEHPVKVYNAFGYLTVIQKDPDKVAPNIEGRYPQARVYSIGRNEDCFTV